MLQLTVREININPSANHPLLQKSRSMYEYSVFIQKIRDYIRLGEERSEAITRAMTDCEKEGIMVEFIRRYGSEVRNMLFTEFNLEDAREVWEEEAREEGIELGIKALILDGFEEKKTEEQILEKLVRRFSLSREKAMEYLRKYENQPE